MVSASHSTRPLQSSCKQLWNKKSLWVHSSYWHHPSQKMELFSQTATLQGLNLKWITVVLYVPQFEDRLLTGKDLEGDQDRHGLELLRTIWNLSTLVCTPRGGEHKIVLTGRTSWWQQRFTRGMLLMMMIKRSDCRTVVRVTTYTLILYYFPVQFLFPVKRLIHSFIHHSLNESWYNATL